MSDSGRGLEIVHVVRSDSFAGVERYVCRVANALSRRGHRVHVIGGDPGRMQFELDQDVRHSPAVSVGQAWRSLASVGPISLVHAHMTAAETAAVCSRFSHRAPIVSTRHFPDRRGGGGLGRVAGVVIRQALTEQIAISKFVAAGIAEPSVLLYNGVPSQAAALLETPRVVMMQRLEREKAPWVALHAWASSGLAARGWHLAIAGSGSLESALRRACIELDVGGSVRFLGNVADTDALLRETSILIAPASAEPFGLTVAEAMAHGIPVVAAAGGAHLEIVGADGCLFPPGDVEAAGSQLARLGEDRGCRQDVGGRLRIRQRRLFSLDAHVERLEQLYLSILRDRPLARPHLNADSSCCR